MELVEIVGIRFKSVGKIYYFAPCGMLLHKGDRVIVETVRGQEIGTVIVENQMTEQKEKFTPLSPVIRVATEEDIETDKQNREKEKSAFEICEEKIKKHGLEMELVDVEYTFDNNKIIFFFVAEGRVDFRELVKDLASVFKTRIELRQIGVRDETRMIGGLGICGRKVC
ncbi:MAG: stage 0 sporulation protein, partial [Clostridia bacterium]|nr:stage 0 sporulation protein [Clostridia bacterium]